MIRFKHLGFFFLFFCELLSAQNSKEMKSSLEWIEASESKAVETLLSLSSIVSPSGHESDRAHFIAKKMREIGLQDVTVDPIFNVTGKIKGSSGKAVVFVTMLDDLPQIAELQKTAVFSRNNEKVVGPATEKQSANAAMLLAAEALLRCETKPQHDIIFASVAQEEMGLIGMQTLFKSLKDQAVAWIEILGTGEKIVYGAPYIHWWKIIAKGREGHTENVLPHVNLGISCAVSNILALPYPKLSENTFVNVGVIQSGDLYNRKPESGWFSLDLRAMDQKVLMNLETLVFSILDQVKEKTKIHFEMEKVAVLDGGQIPGAKESRLVKLANEISISLGNNPLLSPKGCCNMIVPISHGSLAIGLHGKAGGEGGTVNEWASIPSMIKTAKFVLLFANNF